MIQLKQASLFPELYEAFSNGHRDCFVMDSDGSLKCQSNPSKHYELDDISVTVITCFVNRATLYLITTLDGLYKGVMVDYWEC